MPNGTDTRTQRGLGHDDRPRPVTHNRRGLKRVFALSIVMLSLIAWQSFEHRRVRVAARGNLRTRAEDITNSLGFVMRSQGRFRVIPQDRLEAALREVVESGDIVGIAVLNQDGQPTASAGEPVDLGSADLAADAESWQEKTVTFLNLIDLGMTWDGRETPDPSPVVIVPTDDMTPGDGGPDFPRGPRRGPPEDSLGEEANEKLVALMDGRPMDDAMIAEFLALVPGDGPDERIRKAVRALLIGEPLTKDNAAVAGRLAFSGETPRRGERGHQRFRFPRDQLSEEANRRLDTMADGRVLDEAGVAAFLAELPEGTVDSRRRESLEALLLDASFDESLLRTALYLALGDAEQDGRRPPPFGRPPWLNESEYEELQRARGAHWFALTLSDLSYRTQIAQDLRLRGVVLLAALIAAALAGLAWRAIERSSQLQVRLVRAKDLNLHLREMNLAAAGLVHETKNPLNVVRGLAQMMARDEAAPEPLRDTALQVTEEVDRVTNRLNQFLDYSRPPEVKLAPTDLSRVIEGVCRVLETDRAEKGFTLTVTGPELTVETDEALLRQVVFNLLLNAIQAVPCDGRIQVQVQDTGHHLAALRVRDNGPGVPEEAREDIFRPYYTTTGEGTGLGLAIVRQIALAHQWDIAYEPIPDGGACFCVSRLSVLQAGIPSHAG